MKVIAVFFFFLIFLFIDGKASRETPDSLKQECTVSAYDKIKGFLNWPQVWFKEAVATNCSTKVVFKETRGVRNSNVVIFHAPTHGKGGRLPAWRNYDSLYVMVSMEQPQYASFLQDPTYLQTKFNLTMTYSLSPTYPGTTVPNLPLTYYPLNVVSTEAVMQPERPFADKTGYDGSGVSTVLFTSNCDRAGATERYKYIEELMKHIKIHSYGRCFNNIKEPKSLAKRTASKVKILSYYKFYLAFENAPVEDYVSEKVFDGLISSTVVVYRGASSIHRFMPSNDSFVDANTMKPADLAALLNRLSNKEKEYNKFFEFKKRPLSPRFEEMAQMSYAHPNALCRVCDYYMAHRKK